MLSGITKQTSDIETHFNIFTAPAFPHCININLLLALLLLFDLLLEEFINISKALVAFLIKKLSTSPRCSKSIEKYFLETRVSQLLAQLVMEKALSLVQAPSCLMKQKFRFFFGKTRRKLFHSIRQDEGEKMEKFRFKSEQRMNFLSSTSPPAPCEAFSYLAKLFKMHKILFLVYCLCLVVGKKKPRMVGGEGAAGRKLSLLHFDKSFFLLLALPCVESRQ